MNERLAMSAMLRIAHFVPCTEAEGPYRRFALWTQGCHLRCPGCCNPELFSPKAGQLWSISQLLKEIVQSYQQNNVEGITVLGGEPLEQMVALTALCVEVAKLGIGVIIFSGYRLDEARELPGFSHLFETLDTFVDGRYQVENAETKTGRRWLGSTNQRIIHRNHRYADPGLWTGPNHAEIQISKNGVASVHGFPVEVKRLLQRLQNSLNSG